MSIKKIICLVLCAVMLITVLPLCANADELQADYAPGEAIIRYTQTVENQADFISEENIPWDLKSIGINSVKIMPVEQIYDTSIKSNLDGTLTKETCFVGYFNGDVNATCQKLSSLENIISASPNILLQNDSISIPTEVTSPTSMYKNYTKWWLEDVLHLDTAWEQFDTLGEGTVVAVLDSGFNINHPEFTGRIWEDPNGFRGFNAVTYTSDVSPDTTHGNNVAGIIANSTGYNANLIGVAPESQIIPIKVSSNIASITIDAVVSGINYAIASNVDVISMSVSTTGNSADLYNACQAAYDSGIVVVSSASNSAKSITEVRCYPAAYDFVIGVMASGKDGQLCNFSNYDSSLQYYNIAAPGYQILGFGLGDTSATSITAYSGTSQSTPIISGLAALYLSIYPDHTPDEFKRSLYNSSTDTVTANSQVVTDYSSYTFPVANAVNLLSYPNTEPSLYKIAGSTTQIDDANSFIFGLEQGITSLEGYIGVDNGTYELVPTANGYGTGTIVRVKTNTGVVFRDYEIVIFGDTDGDGKCDGMDTVLCDYAVASGSVPDCVKFACDVDFNDKITEADSAIISGCGTFTNFVTQIR